MNQIKIENFCSKAYNHSFLQYLFEYKSESGKSFRNKYKGCTHEEWINNSRFHIREMPKKLMKNKNFVLQLIEKYNNYEDFQDKIYQHLPRKLRKDADIINASYNREISVNGKVYKFLPASLKNKELVLQLLNNSKFYDTIYFYYSLSKKLRNDKDVIAFLINKNFKFYTHLDKNLKNSLEFVLWATNLDYKVIIYVKKEFKEDKKILYPLLEEYPSLYLMLPDYLRENEEIIDILRQSTDIQTFVFDNCSRIGLFPSSLIKDLQLENPNFIQGLTEVYANNCNKKDSKEENYNKATKWIERNFIKTEEIYEYIKNQNDYIYDWTNKWNSKGLDY